jgi:A/G-specific adenine glycosylase
MDDFARRLLRWHDRHGRHDLPWQHPATPYRVWVSEVMLQQTQVGTVIPYFLKFMECFPDVRALAAAPQDAVLHRWSGLGYYARARNLHRAARMICEQFGGALPQDLEALMALPGIGRSTAGAILALSADRPFPILDGNVKRVLSRYHAVPGWPGRRQVEDELWRLSASHLPQKRAGAYTQAIMDLGATLCTRSHPRCDDCPLGNSCRARREGLQAQLPGKKPRRALPTRSTVFAMIENRDGEILLERRPPSGVWGGLWSFPECAPERDMADWLRERFGWSAKEIQQRPLLRHTFTHFHLDIQPVRVRLRAGGGRVAEADDMVWLKPAPDMNRGLAAPVRKLIDDMLENPAGDN